MPDFSRRSTATELMDTEETDFETFRACLVDLAKVNTVTLAYGPTFAFLERLRREGRLPTDRPLSIVDTGSGYGDMLRKVARWAERRGIPVSLTGIDLNPWSAQAATEASRTEPQIRWVTTDLFAFKPDGPIDLVISSLFTHHLDDDQRIRFVAWMEEVTALGWFINDLHRHAFPYYGFAALSKVMGWHRFVQHDGPVSIARAFRREDWRRTLAGAHIPEGAAQIAWRFPFRLCVERVKGR